MLLSLQVQTADKSITFTSVILPIASLSLISVKQTKHLLTSFQLKIRNGQGVGDDSHLVKLSGLIGRWP